MTLATPPTAGAARPGLTLVGRSHLRSSMVSLSPRWIVTPAVLAAALIGVASPAAAGAPRPRRCPSHPYWTNIHVYRMTCEHAVQLHREKLRNCTHAHRRATPHAYVYTCMFGPWESIERVGRLRFSDRIYISRDAGRVWMRYDALP